MEKRILVFLEAGVRARPEDLVASRPKTVLELMAKQLLCRAAQADLNAIRFVLSFWRRPGNGVRRRRLSAGVKRTLIYGHAEETWMAQAKQAGTGVSQGDLQQTREDSPLPSLAQSGPPPPQAEPRAGQARIPVSLENDARTEPDSQGIIEKVTCANWPGSTTTPCKKGFRARAGP